MSRKLTETEKKTFENRFEGKQLLIESTDFLSKVELSKDLKESVKLSSGKAGTLIVKNIPTTILNRTNMNNRIYSTTVMEAAIADAQEAFKTKQLFSQAKEHPEGSFVAPTEASHVVINSYIKRGINIVVEGKRETHDVMFQDWEILNTREGKDLRALFEAECSIGTSIRGVGDMNGKNVEDYVLLGCDCVGNPSSSTFTRMPVSESVKVEFKDENTLNETFTVSTSSTNVVRDLEAAANIQEKLDAIGYGTVVKTSTKVNEETDPKTGAQTSITTLEAETADDVTSLDHALMMAKNAMLNGVVNVDSITIENIPEEEVAEAIEASLVEAKEDTAKDKQMNRKFILKTQNGFVSMDGNTLTFTEVPEDALHFVEGKENSGMIHLSNIEKILDAMGILEAERFFFKEEKEDASKIEENISLEEENGSNTRFSATVKKDDNGAVSVETIPVSATEMDSVIAEVSNLWEMKAQSDPHVQPQIKVTDTIENKEYYYDPVKNNLESLQTTTVQEEAEGIEQEDNTLEVKFDDGQTVEKEFESDAEANVAKAGLEKGTLSGDIMFDENVKINQEGMFKPGWYVGADKVGISGPYESEETARFGLEEFEDTISCNYLEEESNTTPENVFQPGWYVAVKGIGISEPFASEEEARAGLDGLEDFFSVEYLDGDGTIPETTVQEKVFSQPTGASDEYVEIPLIDEEKESSSI